MRAKSRPLCSRAVGKNKNKGKNAGNEMPALPPGPPPFWPWLENNRALAGAFVTILLALIGWGAWGTWHASEKGAEARLLLMERDEARTRLGEMKKRAEDAEAARHAAVAERDRARELHPLLQAFGPDVWAYRRYTIKRKSAPVTIPVPTFAGGPTYTLRFVGFSEDANGVTRIEGEWDSDRPLSDRFTGTMRRNGVEKQVAPVSHFGMTAKPGCRTLLGEAEVAVEAVVERVSMDGVELGIAAHPNPEPKEMFGKKLSTLLGDCPEERVGAAANP